jgi:alpha-beta hydrolase superfamily lysophospholipase
MSANPHISVESMPHDGLADALYFDSGPNRLFGWLHRPPAGASANVGLVICKPFGYEALCAHRGVRAFAESAAALGLATLRFDYAGTNDSSEIDREADQLQIWTQDIAAAVAELRRLTGVGRVCLLGFRLGGLLAMRAASGCEAVTSIILVSPVLSGRRYLRELRTARLAASMGSESVEASSASPRDAAAASASMEASGFMIAGATLAALAQIDLKSNLGAPPTREMLIIDGASMPVAREWSEQVAKLGVAVTYRSLPGLIEMILTGPQFAQVPLEMIAAVRDWLTVLAKDSVVSASEAGGSPKELARPPIASMDLPMDASGAGTLVTERPVFLGSGPLLFGIVTEPRQDERRRRAVVLINSGADHHIGASGMYVGLARRWARRGYVVLRVDLAGLGDSSTRPGQPDNVVFPPAAIDDIRVAIDWMRSRYRADDITLCGLCSGAYHSLRAAVAALPINRILMVNPETFFWDQSMSIYGMQLAELVTDHRGKLVSATAWKRLLSGQVNVRYILKRQARRLWLALESRLRDAARRVHLRLPHDIGTELEEIAARGVRIVFIFSRNEPGIALLKLQGGVSLKRLGERCRVHIIDGADHVFSKFDSRKVLEDVLSNELFTPVEWNIAHRAALPLPPQPAAKPDPISGR